MNEIELKRNQTKQVVRSKVATVQLGNTCDELEDKVLDVAVAAAAVVALMKLLTRNIML